MSLIQTWVRSLFLWVSIIIFMQTTSASANQSTAVAGSIDLKNWNPNQTLALEGEWHFFWDELLSPQQALERLNSATYQPKLVQIGTRFRDAAPDKRSDDFGFATYVLSLRNLPSTELYVSSLAAYSSYKFYFFTASTALDATPSGISGRVARTKEDAAPDGSMPEFLPLSLQPAAEHFIVIQISNFHNTWGGMWIPPRIGHFKAVLNRFQSERNEVCFVLGMFALIFLYNLSFFLRRREDKASLFLALFVLATFIRTFWITNWGKDFFNDAALSYELTAKAIYLSMFLLNLFFMHFLQACFPQQMPRWLPRVSWTYFSLPLLVVIFTPVSIHASLSNYIKIGVALHSLILMNSMIQSARARETGALISLIGSLFVFTGAMLDITTSWDIIRGLPTNSTSLGLVAFAACQSQIIAARFAVAFRKSEHLSRSLAAEVERQTRDIKTILKHIRQGIFTILPPSGQVDEQYSEHLVPLLGKSDIAGRSIDELLLSQSDLSSDAKSQIEAALDASLGEGSVGFELNEANFIHEINYQSGPDEPKKILEVDWNPIIDKDDIVEKILVSLRDVTEVRQLKHEADQREDDLRIILELLQIPEEKFQRFTAKANDYLKENRELILGDPGQRHEVIKRLFMNMHTIKGAARTFFLKAISSAAHDVEQYYAALQRNEVEWDSERLMGGIEAVHELIIHYQEVGEERLGWSGRERQVKVDRSQIEQQLMTLQDIDSHGLPPRLINGLRSVESFLGAICYDKVSHLIEEASRGLDSIARDLSKIEPVIHRPHDTYLVKEEGATFLYNAFLHLFRNSMDHGIELPGIREQRGKPGQGSIFVEIEPTSHGCVMRYKDDGNGLDIPAICAKGLDRGLLLSDRNYTDNDIAGLIFLSGFSTKTAVSHISGRGVGLDAVKSFSESVGVTLSIRLLPTDNRHQTPFLFEFIIPSELFWRMDLAQPEISLVAS